MFMQRVQNGQIIDKIGMDEIEEVIHAEADEEAQASSALDRCSSLEHCPSLSTLCNCVRAWNFGIYSGQTAVAEKQMSALLAKSLKEVNNKVHNPRACWMTMR